MKDTLDKAYDVGWKHGYKAGVKTGLVSAVGFALFVVLSFGQKLLDGAESVSNRAKSKKRS